MSKLKDFTDVVSLLNAAIIAPSDTKESKNDDYKYIRTGFNKELDELRGLFKNSRTAIAAIESRERERTGIKTLRISYNRVFG